MRRIFLKVVCNDRIVKDEWDGKGFSFWEFCGFFKIFENIIFFKVFFNYFCFVYYEKKCNVCIFLDF